MMKFPIENLCRVCGNLYCCEKCRARHEIKLHSNEINSILKLTNICTICKGEPFILRSDTSSELLSHIAQKHLPLYCKKCCKIYTTEVHLIENEKCFAACGSCSLRSEIPIVVSSPVNDENLAPASKVIQNLIAVSTQTSPSLLHLEKREIVTSMTSSSMLEKQLKQKHLVNEGNLTDSTYSLKNMSSLSISTQKTANITSGAKLVRTTSTPMQQQLLATLKEHHFNSPSAHVSSIHAETGGESDVSPSTENYITASSPSGTKLEGKLQGARGRGKMPVSATPLRQVMSKSIQRAIAEHGALTYRDQKIQPKKIFDSLNMSCSLTPPLDLRTTPVLRRTQSEIVDRSSLYEEFHTSRTSSRKHVIASTKRIITEDVIISSNSIYEKFATVYETCCSVEASTNSFSQQLKESNKNDEFTSKMDGGVLKKSISFDTPQIRKLEQKSSIEDEGDDEVFYTPTRNYTESDLNLNYENKSIHFKMGRKNSGKENGEKSDETNNDKQKNRGKLWSLVSSVMRLASFGKDSNESSTLESSAMGVVKRCASFAGILTKPSDNQVPQQAKRKRTNTIDTYPKVSPESSTNSSQELPSKRIKRIKGRKPIERMRNISHNFD